MRIGLIAPPWVPVPPPAYGGTEVVVDNLARGLRRLGHDVRLFTVGESTCPVDRRYLYAHAVEPMGEGCREVAHALAAYEELADVDVIHDHTLLGALVGRRASRPPIVVTNHGPFTMEARRIFEQLAGAVRIVAISHAQARTAGSLPIAAVIHNGIDLDVYRPGPGGGGYLLFVGRMSPDKGVHRAIRVAHEAGWPLHIITKMREAAEREYYQERVAPLLMEDDSPPQERPLNQRLELMACADALLNPIRWPEPFGLVMAEALACGTPVFAFPHGAAPEIVDSGRTGFLCKDEADMARAVGRLDQISRDDCRSAAERRFGMDRMATEYARLYARIVAEGRSASTRQLVVRTMAKAPARRLTG